MAQINFVGGDKPVDKLKDMHGEEVSAYQEALTELVKAVGVADLLGKTFGDF